MKDHNQYAQAFYSKMCTQIIFSFSIDMQDHNQYERVHRLFIQRCVHFFDVFFLVLIFIVLYAEPERQTFFQAIYALFEYELGISVWGKKNCAS